MEYGDGLVHRVRELAPQGVDVVADFVGGVLQDTQAVLRNGGRHASIADPAVTEQQVTEYYALIRRFDRAVDTAASNTYLVDALETLRTHVARVRRKAGASPVRLAASALEHALIASAIANHDAALAVHATHVHLHNSLEHFRHDYTGLGAESPPQQQEGHRHS